MVMITNMSDDLSARVTNLEAKVTDIQVRQAEIHGAVHHIKTRIDNGMGKTIHEIAEKLDKYTAQSMAFQSESSQDRAVIKANLKEHGWWVGAVKTFIFSISALAITGGVFALFSLVPK